MRTLLVIYESGHDGDFDAAVVLRGMYDCHLQGLYVLQKPATRGVDFQDFIWVQTKDTVDWIEKSDSQFAEMCRNDPFFYVGLPGVDAHYKRVRGKFLTKQGDKCRPNWFKGTLKDLAKSVGYASEYELMQPKLSGSVHSTPYAMIHGPGLPKQAFLDFGWMFVFRILGGIADYLKIDLDEYEKASVEHGRHSITEYPGV